MEGLGVIGRGKAFACDYIELRTVKVECTASTESEPLRSSEAPLLVPRLCQSVPCRRPRPQ
jgi:hypothetical protein